MASPTESSLLAKLESSDLKNIYHQFSDYLHPFTDLRIPKKPANNGSSKDDQTLIRSLAKRFLPFINRSLSILPKCLSDSSSLRSQDKAIALELFETYKLCLNCLECVSSQLSCKPHTIQLQRIRLMHCMEAWGLSKDAESEGLRVLEKLRGTHSGSKSGELKGLFVRGGDEEFGLVVVEVVAAIVKCVAIGQSKDSADYRRVLGLVEEIRPWFRVSDASPYEKLHRVLVTYLGKCTLFLVAEIMHFDGDLVQAFCLATLTEYAKSSLKDQIYKFARRMCSSLFSVQENRSLLILDILICVLDSVSRKCKVETDSCGIEFVELVSYCANKCRTAGTIFCSTVARHLNDIAGDFHQAMTPFDLILRLYVTGLYFTDCDVKSRGGDFTSSRGRKDESSIRILLDDGDTLHNLAALLGSLGSYFHIGCNENRVFSSVEYKDSVSQIYLELDSNHEAFITNRQDYLLSYLSALKFLCQPLAEIVNSGKKQIVDEVEASSVSTELCDIQDAFHQFCDVFLFSLSCTSERERDGFDDNKTIVSVAVAAFVLSVRAKLKMQKSVYFIKYIIASDWIQPQGLKFLFASLYNIGVLLYRNKQVKEASKALKLCCRASWTCVLLLCKMFVQNLKASNSDLSEDSIVDFVTEACARSAFLLDVLHQCGSLKVKKIILESLENWAVAENMFRKLPGPTPLVKQWVKIECKLRKDVRVEDSAPTLYCLLSSSVKVSKRIVGRILEQEFLAYEEMSSLYPELCQRMQMKIISILLGDVYVTQDSYLQKSRILLRKGKMLRAQGIEGLKDCIQCVSAAISIMNDVSGETCSQGTPLCHQLAVAYCLRALCIQEAEPNSKQPFQDVNAAINLWLSTSIPDNCYVDDECNMVSENIMLLLYTIVDLLSIKGCMEFHHDIYELMIRLFKWKNLPIEKCLAKLWEGRRLSHALCISSINEAFVMKLTEHCGELSKSIDFWIHCLKESQPLLIGFKQNFSFLLTNFPHGIYNHESFFRSHIKVDVIEAASELISSAPVTSRSVFLAGYLYYDLCERLMSNGRLFEALSYAKEAHRLRTRLFQEKFTYSVEQQTEEYNEAGDTTQKLTYGIRNLEVFRSVASEVWSFDTISMDLDTMYLSPWNVLQCYLESTLQVGLIHEIIGNGVEAETFLLWGKDISCSQSLPLFTVAFSFVLGKLYRKKRLWDLAEKQLQSAKQTLVNSMTSFSCLKCRLMLEATVDQELGDLSRSHFDSATCDISIERLSQAESLYKSALDKLNLSQWKNSISCPKEASAKSMMFGKAPTKNVENGASDGFARSSANQPDAMDLLSTREGPKAKLDARKCKKIKNAPKSLVKEHHSEHNTRVTRSKYRSSQNQSVSSSDEVQVGLSKHLKGKYVSDLSDTLSQRVSHLETGSCTVDFGCEGAFICQKMKCWHCLPMEVMESGLLNNYINLKWEFFRRRLSVRVLTGIGKCLEYRDQIHETHEIILQSLSVLVSRNPFCHTCSSVPVSSLLDLIGKEFLGDVFAVERAALLYNLCWFSLKSYHSKDIRSTCCDLSHIQLPKVISWLMLAFVLCREVPILFQKVSRLLAAIYLLSASSELFSLSSSCKVLSENQWASYFHQASLGTHLSYKFFSNTSGRSVAQHLKDAEGSHVTGSSSMGAESCNLLRLAPESVQDLEQFVIDFFVGLPCTTVICISLLGGAYASLLQELLLYPSCVHAWMLLSRMNSKSQPIVVLLPVDLLLEEVSDDEADSSSGELSESNALGKHWHCPWGSTVVDDVAPAFKLILEENYLSSSIFPLEDTKKNRSLWWMRRKKLDHRLGKLLRNLEDSWLGAWRFMLLGEQPNCKLLDSVYQKLVRDLKSKCKMDVNESLVKLIIGGARYGFEGEACISQLCLKKGCFMGRVGYCGEESCRTPSNPSSGVEKLSGMAFQLIQEAVNDIEEEASINREPIILVLDCEVQMLPWENIPILRNQEVYRMPSVGSISAMLDRSRHHQEQVERVIFTFPLIDPLDAFYLLNPSGDLSSTQVEFENWFRDQNLEGKAGSAPTAEELAVALKNHDLFIYFGHGSGAQYIPSHEIQKLEKCAATLLMGCSSGSLSLNGCYIPQGMPLSYLLAGSPVIVANLWEVTDKDIDRFGKAMLDAWLRERSSISVDCAKCNLAKEFEGMNLRGCKGNAKKKLSRKKVAETCDSGSCKNDCDHRSKIGSFMGQAREACTLPFLIGASPVCYGVPTGITKKKDL